MTKFGHAQLAIVRDHERFDPFRVGPLRADDVRFDNCTALALLGELVYDEVCREGAALNVPLSWRAALSR